MGTPIMQLLQIRQHEQWTIATVQPKTELQPQPSPSLSPRVRPVQPEASASASAPPLPPVTVSPPPPADHEDPWSPPRCEAQRDAPGYRVPPLPRVFATEAEAVAGGKAAGVELWGQGQGQEQGRRGDPEGAVRPVDSAQALLRALRRAQWHAPSSPHPSTPSPSPPWPLSMRPSPRRYSNGSVGVPDLGPDSAFHALQAAAATLQAKRDPAGDGDAAGAAAAPAELWSRSTFTWSSLSAPFLHGPSHYDAHSRVADLTMVSFYDGRLHVYLSAAEMEALVLPEWTPHYKLWRGGRERIIDLHSQVQFHSSGGDGDAGAAGAVSGALGLHHCAEWVEESAVVHTLWHSDNAFHAHNDNLLPLFGHMRSAGLLAPDAAKRLYLHGEAAHGEQSAGKTNTLVRSLIDRLFDGNVHDMAALVGTSLSSPSSSRYTRHRQLCFRHLRWGRGGLPGFERRTFPLSDQCGSLESLGLWPPQEYVQLRRRHEEAAAAAAAGSAPAPAPAPLPSLRAWVLSAPASSSYPPAAAAVVPLSGVPSSSLSWSPHHQERGLALVAGDRAAFQRWAWRSLGLEKRVRDGWTETGRRELWGLGEEADARPADYVPPSAKSDAPGPTAAAAAAATAALSSFSVPLSRLLSPSPSGSAPSAARFASCDARRHRPHIVYMARNGARSVANEEEFLAALIAPSNTSESDAGSAWRPRLTRCCDWSALSGLGERPLAAHLVSLLHSADLLVGVHGAGLTHLLYMPTGGAVVELQPNESNWQMFFPVLARGLQHLAVEIDLRSEQHGAGGVRLGAAFMARVAAEVQSQWLRHSPCSAQEERQRRDWHSRERPFAERFPMADLKGDRARHVGPDHPRFDD